MKKTKDVSDEDEFSADDPEEVEDAASEEEDWNSADNNDAESPNKKQSDSSLTKKRTHSDEEDLEEEEDFDDDDDDDEDDEDDEEDSSDYDSSPLKKRKRRSRNEDDDDSDEVPFDPNAEPPKDFTSGAFVIAKADMDKDSDPTLWRIDGKALLQKYLPIQESGKTLYKSTSTYSGWSPLNKDRYYAAQVSFKSQDKTETVVELLPHTEEGTEMVKDAKED